jgi:hypothetical protein
VEKANEKKDVSVALRFAYYISTISAALLLISAFIATRPSLLGIPDGWFILETCFFAFFGFQAFAMLLAVLGSISIFKQKTRGIALFIFVMISVAFYSSLALVFYNHIFWTP